jgi:predicted metalloprotease with PDZ domain
MEGIVNLLTQSVGSGFLTTGALAKVVRRTVVVVAVLVLSGAGLLSQSAGPQPTPMPPPIVAPKDVRYPGTISLSVDASDIERRIFSVRETLPVTPGQPLVLLFPQWLPGSHSPTGRVDKIAGLTVRANGTRLPWRRDVVDVFAFHVDVPPAVTSLDIEFQFTSPVEASEGRVVMTTEMLNLQWNLVLLYPAGYFTRQITVEPSVRLPDGWQFGTALETASTASGVTTFKPVTLETLVDSPMFAGKFFKRFDLDTSAAAPVHLNVVADRADLIDVKPEQLEAHRELVRQAYKLYGSHHYDHYDFLLALTDRMGSIGLEHHRSSEDGTVPMYFTAWERNTDEHDLLAHEYTHSWNGKFRRPADLWTPNYNVPMRGSLLWVYEGQTEYWGYVLAARAGLLTKQQALDAIGSIAATYAHRIGREWRTLQDTTTDPVAALRRPLAWRSWERSEDYYYEGQLIWLDVDTLIREKSGDRKSLDDFASAFFGVGGTSDVPVTYTFEDVVNALNAVQPYDWGSFLAKRLESHGPAPLDGVTRGGYKLTYGDTPTDYFRNSELRRRVSDLMFSLGCVVSDDGRLTEVLWDGPAFKNSLTLGTQIISVNGSAYSGERIKEAIRNAQKDGTPIELNVKNGDRYRSITFDYRDGLRYPRLERDASKPARLDQILAKR